MREKLPLPNGTVCGKALRQVPNKLKMTEEDERSEEGHKVRLESSRGCGFLGATVRKVDFIQSETASHQWSSSRKVT